MDKKKCTTANCENMTSEGKCMKCRSPAITISPSRKCAKCENRVRKNDLCAACSRTEKKLKPCGIPGCPKKTKDDICSTCKIRSLSKANKAAYESFIRGATRDEQVKTFQDKYMPTQLEDNIYQPPLTDSEDTDSSNDIVNIDTEQLFLNDLDKLLKQHNIETRKTNLIKKIVLTIIDDA